MAASGNYFLHRLRISQYQQEVKTSLSMPVCTSLPAEDMAWWGLMGKWLSYEFIPDLKWFLVAVIV